MARQPGTRLGMYHVTATIGDGGMGAVDKTHDAPVSCRISGRMRWLVVFSLALCSWQPTHATNHQVRINEVMAGLNGDSSIQFFEMVSADDGQKLWGPNGASVGRAMVVSSTRGGANGRFVIPSNPGNEQTPSCWQPRPLRMKRLLP